MIYGIRAVLSSGASSSMNTIFYRIPFLGTISGSVKSQTGAPVSNVSIFICHIDSTTGENDVSPTFCPLTIAVTDVRGIFSADIRVSHPGWKDTTEQFRLTASLVETIDGVEVPHVFFPADMIVTLNHRSKVTASFSDQTSITIRGNVKFDPTLVNGSFCPFEGVLVYLNSSNGQSANTTTDSQGNFAFSMTRNDHGVLYIPNWRNHSWVVNANVSSYAIPPVRLVGTKYVRIDAPGKYFDFPFVILDSHPTCSFVC